MNAAKLAKSPTSADAQNFDASKYTGDKQSKRLRTIDDDTWRQVLPGVLDGKLDTDDIKQLSHYNRGRLAVALSNSNWKADRIAKLFGVTKRAIYYRLFRRGASGRKGKTELVSSYISTARGEIITKVAAHADASKGALIKRALDVIFESEATAAKHLGKGALPKRRAS